MSEENIPQLGLCMIVKDEEHCIERCLESIYKYIEYWVICDTGSTDKTKEVIQKFFDKKKIPGEIIDMPWEGFGASRTKALNNAKGKMKYAWMIDADDSVVGTPDIPKNMTADGYTLKIKRGDFTWWRNHIFLLDADWYYEGILHEYAACKKTPFSAWKLGGNYHIEARTEGGRNIGVTPQEKYLKDAEVLLDALLNEKSPHYTPDNSRYVFYLAQSYFDAGDYAMAKEWYIKRAQMGGWEEEVYYSMYRVGITSCLLENPWHVIHDAFLQAWAYRPIRAEPLWQLSRLYRQNGNPRLAYLYAKAGLDTPFPENDILFISHDLWEWSLLDEITASAFYVHKFEEGLAACNLLLKNGNVPKAHLQRIKDNKNHYETAIKERIQQEVEQKRILENKRKENEIVVPENKKEKTFKKRKGKVKKGPTQKKEKSFKLNGKTKLHPRTLK
ncbi:MAG: glycosyltransferase [Proteobacteria bacterium]|nr:glycosyltransferase [Pseudomonadota bacterium]